MKTYKQKILSLLFFLTVFNHHFNAQHQKDERPNIIVILADDLGYGDVGFTGCEDIKTPQLDALAENGVVCTNAYVTHPYCGPSRAGILTGRHQARFGMEVNPTNSPFDLHMGLPLEEQTFGERLKTVGYRTAIIGKWHMGGAPPYHPNNRGFDHFYGFLSGGHSYFPSGVNAISPLVNKNGNPNYCANEGDYKPLWRNNGAGEFNEYLTKALSRDAAEFVKSSNKPFLLYLAYNAPHQPLEAPKKTIEKYNHIENKYRRTYAAMIDEMDQGIGMLIQALKEAGKYENTIIFFLSDNGGDRAIKPWQPVHYTSNYPFKNGKGSFFEGGVHVPFLIHWPKGIEKPQQFEGLVSSLDIASTAYALAGVDTANAKLDGVDLIPFMQQDKKGSPHEAIFWREYEGKTFAVRTLDSKYLLNKINGEPQLFDMKKDPYEDNNIVSKNAKKRKQIAALWNVWNADNKSVIWLQSSDYQKRRLQLYDQLHQEMLEKASKRKPVLIE
ncbi:sulfatase family protein [Flammeovirga aprica]|uniref:Sulfatase-like hydrolase/transferase n=1 Tax=Flammeovirga aprica JL-4 TaxID=694437 RepID=A0A7X9S0L5_9BACT|nr:sulfatase-like hydrolase/transferase [Flammeovirga aprica]NME72141.1 sulfatase-like hydrolase/transferase [Flammeovirga aprica JL-4]